MTKEATPHLDQTDMQAELAAWLKDHAEPLAAELLAPENREDVHVLGDNLGPVIPEHAEREHSELSASACKRWWNCPGSIALARGVPRRDTAYSLEGTAAHTLADLCLGDGLTQDTVDFVDRTVAGHLVDDEMAEAVQVYVEFVRGMKGVVQIEKHVRLDSLNPPAPMFGTCDAFAYDAAAKRLHIADLKYGRGVWVPAEGNPQLLYYALGATLALGLDQPVTEIEATIVQPRNTRGGAVRSTTVTPMELLEWSGDLIEHAHAALAPDAPLVAGDHCGFCPVAGKCPRRAETNLAVAQLAFADAVDPRPTPGPAPAILLTNDELGTLLHKLDAIESWAKDAKALALSELRAGRAVGDWKLVESEGRDAWNNEQEAQDFMFLSGLDPYAAPKTVSPAQARGRIASAKVAAAKAEGKKLTKKAAEQQARLDLKGLLHRPKSLSLASASDNRPAVSGGTGLDALPDETDEATEQ